jgi:hypothetical protein
VIQTAWLLVLSLLLVVLHTTVSVFAGAVVRALAVRCLLAMLFTWVRLYTCLLDAWEREIRRADFRRDLLWGRYRRLRRRGYSGADLALHVTVPVLRDMPGDFAEAVSIFADERVGMARWYATERWRMAKRELGRLVTTPDRIRLQRALNTLATDYGFYVTDGAGHALACCRTHSCGEVPDDANGAVLWCVQTDGYAFEGEEEYVGDGYTDWLRHTLWVQWASSGRLIVKTLRDAGFEVRWNGRRDTAIVILPSPGHADPVCTNPECRPRAKRRTRSAA